MTSACFSLPRAAGATRNSTSRKPLVQQRRNVFVPADLFGQRAIVGGQHEMVRTARQTQPAVARSVIANLDRHVLRHFVLGELVQRLDDLIGIDARRRGVPDRQRRDAIRVDVFGRLDQFGEPGQMVACLDIARTVHLDQHGMVALHDQRVVRLIDAH